MPSFEVVPRELLRILRGPQARPSSGVRSAYRNTKRGVDRRLEVEAVLPLLEHLPATLPGLRLIATPIILDDKDLSIREARPHLFELGSETIEHKLLDLLLDEPFGLGDELDGLGGRVCGPEVFDGHHALPIPSEADLRESRGVEVDVDALIRGPVSSEDHRQGSSDGVLLG